MTYVDGFVVPVRKSKLRAYVKMAKWGKRMWMKHGALAYYECAADQLESFPGCGDFKKMAKLKAGETVFFSFIVYKNRAHQKAVNKKVMAEMQKQPMPKDMPFEMKRMAYGGFRTVVQG
jgi:uncharacterized protein YbaA (DUF1428 family)